MQPKLFALPDKDKGPAQEVTAEEARELNQDDYGIFHVVNEFGGRRLIKNLSRIRYWFADIDEGNKEEQLDRILCAPVIPSKVVESANGYHVYYRAKDATFDNWYRIVRYGVVPKLGGDPKATDPLRLLRAPGFYHHKGEPFMVRVVHESPAIYTEGQMLEAFPDTRETPKEKLVRDTNELEMTRGGFWHRVAALDGCEAIRKLSGHWLCKGERFALQEQHNGNHNIYRVDPEEEYSTGCWVWGDTGKLGGVEDGSSVAAWCKWYGWNWSDVAKGLKELFPELEDEEEQG